jgi:hypothetical protein
MTRTLRFLPAAALLAVASGAAAQTPAAAPAPAPASAPVVKDVPLPPPPAGTKPVQRPAAAPSAEDAAVSAAAAAAAAEAGTPAPAAGATPATAAPPSAAPAYFDSGAKPSLAPAATGPGEPDMRFTPGKTGGGTLTVTQDLESDKIRQAWLQAGGSLPAFEGNLGMLLMYKDLSKTAGSGAYMNGVGISAGLKVAVLYLDPPDYDKQETSWTAWKVGLGGDMGATAVTLNNPNAPSAYRQISASMASTTLIFNLGFLHAMGAFSGPSDWNGFAIGLDWAPSSQRTTMTSTVGGYTTTQTSSSFNASGFAINFETGNLATLTSKIGKKAKLKLSIFILPPTGDIPFIMNTTFGAVWY